MLIAVMERHEISLVEYLTEIVCSEIPCTTRIRYFKMPIVK